MRHLAVVVLAHVLLACSSEPSSDAGATDTANADAPGLDAPGLDAPALDAPALDAGSAVDAFEPIDPDAIYIAPDGDDATGDGSMGAPFFTLVRAWGELAPGRTLYLRGGTYAYAEQQYLQLRDGTPDAMIRVLAYPGEQPTFVAAPGYVGQDLIYFEGSYVHFRGLEIRDFHHDIWTAFRSDSAQHCIFERFDYHHNAGGMAIRMASDGNLILDSDFHHCGSPADGYDGGDGLDVSFTAAGTTNTVRGCRAYWNGDDGFDFYASEGHVVIEGSWAFYNGYVPGTFDEGGNGSGFKLGLATSTSALLREVRSCVAYRNRLWGFVENDAPVAMVVVHNTSVHNGGRNYWFGSWERNRLPGADEPMIIRNNIQYGEAGPGLDDMPYTFADIAIVDHNSWNVATVTDADFESLDPEELLAPRGPDGHLPVIRFLHLAAGSDLVDVGVDVGVPYRGAAPDLGAFER